MLKRLLIANIFFYLFFCFITIALVFNTADIHGMNIAISHWIQNYHNHYADVVLSLLTFLMSGEVCVFFSIIFSIYCYIYYRQVYLAIWIFMIGVVIEMIIKHYIFMPEIDLEYRNLFELGITVDTNYSYPSGHALRSAFFGIFLSYFTIRYWQWDRPATMITAFVITSLLLYSRSYLGAHWFVDVVGGGLLGAALALTAIIIMEVKLKKERDPTSQA